MNSDDDVPIMYEQQPEDYYEKESKLNPLITIYRDFILCYFFNCYLFSIKCNNGLDIIGLCCACYYAPCYIIYALGTRFDICFR